MWKVESCINGRTVALGGYFGIDVDGIVHRPDAGVSCQVMPVFVHDTNLRFPLDDPVFSEFFDRHRVRITGYDDMARLTDDLTARTADIAFIPAANFFSLRRQPYRPVAAAQAPPDDAEEVSSLLIVRTDSHATTLESLEGSRLIYTHPFCTTSYFATALFLHEHGKSIQHYFRMVPGYAFEAQIRAVLDGLGDATMVQESVWRKDSTAMDRTRVIGRRDHLPAPVFVVGQSADQELVAAFTRLLLNHRPPSTARTLFSGFGPYRADLIERFFVDSAAALPDR